MSLALSERTIPHPLQSLPRRKRHGSAGAHLATDPTLPSVHFIMTLRTTGSRYPHGMGSPEKEKVHDDLLSLAQLRTLPVA